MQSSNSFRTSFALLLLAGFLIVSPAHVFSQNKKAISFSVTGPCMACGTTRLIALLDALPGIISKRYNKESGILMLEIDPSKASEIDIQLELSFKGYDAGDFKAESVTGRDACCSDSWTLPKPSSSPPVVSNKNNPASPVASRTTSSQPAPVKTTGSQPVPVKTVTTPTPVTRTTTTASPTVTKTETVKPVATKTSQPPVEQKTPVKNPETSPATASTRGSSQPVSPVTSPVSSPAQKTPPAAEIKKLAEMDTPKKIDEEEDDLDIPLEDWDDLDGDFGESEDLDEDFNLDLDDDLDFDLDDDLDFDFGEDGDFDGDDDLFIGDDDPIDDDL